MSYLPSCTHARLSLTALQTRRLYTGLALLAAMPGEGAAPDVITFTSLLALCDQAGQGYAAQALYQVRAGAGEFSARL